MRCRSKIVGRFFLHVCLAVGVVACATFQDLKVQYRLPETSFALEGRRMELKFQDARPSLAILGPGAVPEFKNFTGDITFSIDNGAGAELSRGRYRVMEMVQEAFERRMEIEGISLTSPDGGEELRLVVIVKELLLDLIDGRWVARMGFQAELEKNGTRLAAQEISGEAERHQIVGKREAHRAMSEIFTDVVNRLDLNDLFEKAERAHPGVLGR